MKKVKLGLALSGGGACGAYEVGAIKVLAKMGFEPRAVAGASIGALNGVVVAAFRLKKAAARLEKIWLDLYPEKVLQLRQDRRPHYGHAPGAFTPAAGGRAGRKQRHRDHQRFLCQAPVSLDGQGLCHLR